MPVATRSIVVYAILGIILLALAVRTGVAAVAPLAGMIDLDVDLVGLPLGILGTIPPIAFAVAASVSPWFAKKVGIEGAAMTVAVLAAIAHVWRGVSPSYLSLFVATAVLMLAAGVGNVILPGLVKLYAPNAIGPVTAAYATAMALSSAAPTVLGVWLASSYGWRVSLAAWAVVSLVGLFPWLMVLTHAKLRGQVEADLAAGLPPAARSVSLSRSPTAVSIMAIFAGSGVAAYTWFALLPVILVDRTSFTPEQAGLALGLFAIMGLPMSLIVPQLAVRRGFAARLVGAAIVFGVVGLIGLIVAPATATILWVVLVAMAPMTFQLSLALIGKRTANHTSALILSGYVNTVGYLFSALGPLVAGLGFWLTGSWTTSLVFLLLVTLLQIPAMWVLSRENVVDDELAAAGR